MPSTSENLSIQQKIAKLLRGHICDDLAQASLTQMEMIGRNKRGVITARLKDPEGRVHYIKFSENISAEDLSNEAQRTSWFAQHEIRVAEVVCFIAKLGKQVLVTCEIGGLNGLLAARMDLDGTLFLLGQELKRIHSIPIEECPFRSLPQGYCDAVDSRVIHGDPTLPNIVRTAKQGIGFLDCGDLGIGNRYLDFAAIEMSIDFNFPGALHNAFYDGYGINDLNIEKLTFFRGVYDQL